MALTKTLTKNGKHVELYYGDSYLGKIRLCPSNRTTQATIKLLLDKNIRIVFVDDKFVDDESAYNKEEYNK